MTIGVYAIINIRTWKTYIGSAARASGVARRWGEHRSELARGRHHSRRLQRAWDKYGPDAFEFIVIEECTPDDCLRREQFWMDKMGAADRKFGYNIRPTAGSTLGLVRSQESKRKMSATVTGRKLSSSHRAALSAAHKGAEHAEQARAVAAHRRLSLVAFPLYADGGSVRFESYARARVAGFDTRSIKKVIDGKLNHHKNYLWLIDVEKLTTGDS